MGLRIFSLIPSFKETTNASLWHVGKLKLEAHMSQEEDYIEHSTSNSVEIIRELFCSLKSSWPPRGILWVFYPAFCFLNVFFPFIFHFSLIFLIYFPPQRKIKSKTDQQTGFSYFMENNWVFCCYLRYNF